MYQVLSAKIARQASERFAAYTGWLVLDSRMQLVYHYKRKADAVAACERLNKILNKECTQ